MTKAICEKCEKLREGEEDEVMGWFVCFKCSWRQEQSLAYEEEQERKAFRQLHPEAQAEIRAEYGMAGVDFPY